MVASRCANLRATMLYAALAPRRTIFEHGQRPKALINIAFQCQDSVERLKFNNRLWDRQSHADLPACARCSCSMADFLGLYPANVLAP